MQIEPFYWQGFCPLLPVVNHNPILVAAQKACKVHQVVTECKLTDPSTLLLRIRSLLLLRLLFTVFVIFATARLLLDDRWRKFWQFVPHSFSFIHDCFWISSIKNLDGNDILLGTFYKGERQYLSIHIASTSETRDPLDCFCDWNKPDFISAKISDWDLFAL